MKPPTRLEHASSPVVRALMQAGRAESPSPALFERALGAVGVTGPAVGILAASLAVQTTSAASVSTAAASAVGMGLVAKWVGVGMVAGMVVTGTAVGVGQIAESPLVVAARRPGVSAVSRRPAARPEPRTAPVSEPAAATIASAPRVTARPVRAFALLPETPSPSRLHREVKELDSARMALRRGDVSGALAALDRYDVDQSEGHLASEAMYLRMEVLLRQGDHERASNAARRLLSAYPEGPHAARARAVLSLNDP